MRKYLFVLAIALLAITNEARSQTQDYSWIYLYFSK
jgi:hypothetical protein